MTVANRVEPVTDRLEDIVQKGGIPAPYDRWGARLLGHLRRPVQIVVTGLPGSGKSALISMISGQNVLGSAQAAPVIELTYGEQESVLIERQDGSVETAMGLLRDCDCPADAVRIRQDVPDPGLNGQSYVEHGLSGSPAEMRSALDEIARRADVVIWCSQDFSPDEQALWATMPDRIKDHSFLVLAKADVLMKSGKLAEHIQRLAPVTADEFLGLYPVATLQGIAAQRRADGLNSELWSASGGGHLVGSLRRQIRQGRSADIDRAQIFLSRLGALVPDEPVNENEAPRVQAPRPDNEGRDRVLATGSRAAEAEVEPNAAEPVATDPQTMSILSEAIDMLQEHGQKMLRKVDRFADFDPDVILNNCTEAMSSLARLLEKGKEDDPLGRDARESVEEGEEILMLFQLEQSQEAALDAVTLLLQVRKELIRKVAV